MGSTIIEGIRGLASLQSEAPATVEKAVVTEKESNETAPTVSKEVVLGVSPL